MSVVCRYCNGAECSFFVAGYFTKKIVAKLYGEKPGQFDREC